MDKKIRQIRIEGMWLSLILLVILWSIYVIIWSSITQGNSLFNIKANTNPPNLMPLSILFSIFTFWIIICMYWITKKRIEKHKK
jgi:hypothetical protein